MNEFFDSLTATEAQARSALEVLGAMSLSFVLNLAIGWLYRMTYQGTRYSQDFVQTLIIIGMVTTILIMVVSGNGAIAFGMFAAFSVIRFRRTLGQSRDLAFVFFAMSIGMVVGAGYYLMAVLIALVVGIAIFLLTRTNAFAPEKPSHLLTLRMTNDRDFEEMLAPIFEAHAERTQLIRVSSVQAGMLTELRYGVQLKPETGLAELLEKLQIATGNNRVVLVPTNQEFDADE
jgi:uncharacterized membrane protein YhiD involved in acid resistance